MKNVGFAQKLVLETMIYLYFGSQGMPPLPSKKIHLFNVFAYVVSCVCGVSTVFGHGIAVKLLLWTTRKIELKSDGAKITWGIWGGGWQPNALEPVPTKYLFLLQIMYDAMQKDSLTCVRPFICHSYYGLHSTIYAILGRHIFKKKFCICL